MCVSKTWALSLVQSHFWMQRLITCNTHLLVTEPFDTLPAVSFPFNAVVEEAAAGSRFWEAISYSLNKSQWQSDSSLIVNLNKCQNNSSAVRLTFTQEARFSWETNERCLWTNFCRCPKYMFCLPTNCFYTERTRANVLPCLLFYSFNIKNKAEFGQLVNPSSPFSCMRFRFTSW